jgi:hypothetical protein
MRSSRRSIILCGTAVGVLAAAGHASAAMREKQTGKPAIVFLVAGQSNAGGCGIFGQELEKRPRWGAERVFPEGSTADAVGLPTDASDYTHSYMWMPDTGFERFDPWVNTRPPKRNTKVHGMELPVIHELEKRFPDNDIYVIKYGPSGKSLHSAWNPDVEKGIYARWLEWYGKGMAELSKTYPEVRVVGLYWDQGESDKKKAEDYAANLTNFIARFRKDSGLPNLKFFIRKHMYDFVNTDALVAAQEQVVKADPNCFLLDIDLGNPKKNYETWSYQADNIHLSSKAFAELTKRLFDGALKDATIESFDCHAAE